MLFVCVGPVRGHAPACPRCLFVAATCVALALIDLDVQRLPFAITVPATVVTAVLLAVAGFVDGWAPAGVAALSACVWLAVYGGIWLATTGRGMGLGDVVLAPMLGLVLGWLGWGPSVVGLLGGFFVGALVGVVLLGARRAGRRTAIPFRALHGRRRRPRCLRGTRALERVPRGRSRRLTRTRVTPLPPFYGSYAT